MLDSLPLDFIDVSFRFGNDGYMDYPDEFRDFPVDTLTSDETYTLTEWAVNEKGEVISPVQSLQVHPVDTVFRNIITGNFLNYLDAINPDLTSLHTIQFTILE